MEYLRELQTAVASATRGMSLEDLSRHSDGKWSAAEILEHLLLSYTGTVKGFERVLQTGKPLATSPTLKQRLFRFVGVDLGYMPSGRQAPAMTVPKGISAAVVLQDIVPTIAKMDDVIGRSAAKFGSGACVLSHPILGPLNAPQWRKFHWVHGMHHVKQIEQLRARK